MTRGPRPRAGPFPMPGGDEMPLLTFWREIPALSKVCTLFCNLGSLLQFYCKTDRTLDTGMRRVYNGASLKKGQTPTAG